MIRAADALRRLQDGNARFLAGKSRLTAALGDERRLELTQGQSPFAIVLGCSDSRVPAEIVFDQGLGELFVIRVAGNIVAPSQVGSVEFAATQFGTRLVVVLGHTRCGAVSATLDELRLPSENQSRNIRAIVERVTPAVAPLLDAPEANERDRLEHAAVEANVRHSVAALKHGSEIIEGLLENEGLNVVGAVYSVESGKVDFL